MSYRSHIIDISLIPLQIRHEHVSAFDYFISEIPEFGLPKFRNFGMYKRLKFQEFRNSEIPELQSLALGTIEIVNTIQIVFQKFMTIDATV